nr:unnamed protein product [Digitaria exilis]
MAKGKQSSFRRDRSENRTEEQEAGDGQEGRAQMEASLWELVACLQDQGKQQQLGNGPAAASTAKQEKKSFAAWKKQQFAVRVGSKITVRLGQIASQKGISEQQNHWDEQNWFRHDSLLLLL